MVAFGDVEYAHGEGFTQFLPRILAVTVPAGRAVQPDHRPRQRRAVRRAVAAQAVLRQHRQVPRHRRPARATSRRSTGTSAGRSPTPTARTRWNSSRPTSSMRPTCLWPSPAGSTPAGVATPGGAFSKVYSNFDTSSPLVLTPALDPFARGGRDPASLANILGTEHINGTSKLDTVDAKVTIDLVEPARRARSGWRSAAPGGGRRSPPRADLNGTQHRAHGPALGRRPVLRPVRQGPHHRLGVRRDPRADHQRRLEFPPASTPST